MNRTFLAIVLGICGLVAVAQIGSSPRYIEELAVGGGTADTVDGGTDLEKDGDIASTGSTATFGDDDATANTVSIYGDNATTSGELRIYNGASEDFSQDYWTMFTDGNGPTNTFRLGTDIDTSLLSINASGTLISTGAAARFGESDIVHSEMRLWGGATNSGGELQIYNSATEDSNVDSWEFEANDFLQLGINTDEDLFIFDSTGNVGAQSYLPTGLVGHWPLNDGTGTSALDASLNTNTGTITAGAGAWSTDSPFRHSYDFDGADTLIDCGSDSTLDDITTLTLSLWLKADGLGEGSQGRLFSKGWFVRVQATEELRFTNFYSGTDGTWSSSSNELTHDTWHHLVLTYDNSDAGNDPIFYVDGQTITVNEDATPVGNPSSDALTSLIIGNETGQTTTFDGHIAEVMIFDRILTAEEVQRLYIAASESPTFQDVAVTNDITIATDLFGSNDAASRIFMDEDTFFSVWGDTAVYGIVMGSGTHHNYGPVTNFSTLFSMNSTADRGWVFGDEGAATTPVFAISNTGDWQAAGDGVNVGDLTIQGASISTPVTITTDTTPTAAGRKHIHIGAWTAANDITDFDNETAGQELLILGGDTDCNIVDGSGIELVGGTTWNAAANATIKLYSDGTTWVENWRAAP